MLTLQHEEKKLKEDEKVLNAEIKQLKDDMNNFEMNFKSGQNKYKGKRQEESSEMIVFERKRIELQEKKKEIIARLKFVRE